MAIKKSNDMRKLDPEERVLLKEIRHIIERAQVQAALIDEILVKVHEYIEKQSSKRDE